MDIAELYKQRWEEKELKKRRIIWKVLCQSFFQRYVSRGDIVLDIGACFCDFINHIECGVKYAVDLNPDLKKFANSDVRIYVSSSTDLSFLENGSVDVVFISNFLEHLCSKEEIVRTLGEAYRVLKSGGRILLLQPNIRYLAKEYWDFFDHHQPLSDKSLAEVLGLTGFRIRQVWPRFLPYTAKSHLIWSPLLIKIYVKMPFLWIIFGRQVFIVADKQ